MKTNEYDTSNKLLTMRKQQRISMNADYIDWNARQDIRPIWIIECKTETLKISKRGVVVTAAASTNEIRADEK